MCMSEGLGVSLEISLNNPSFSPTYFPFLLTFPPPPTTPPTPIYPSLHTYLFHLHTPGLPEGRGNLPSEAAAAGEPSGGDPAGWRDGGPSGPAKGAQRPAEGKGGRHAGP